jgi:gas vesicle protein
MSYAGKVVRGRSGARELARRWEGSQGPLPAEPRPSRPRAGNSEIDWKHIAIFASGVAIGLTVGASVALLMAPQSGRATRRDIVRRGRRLRRRSADAWDDLRHELHQAARRGRKSLASRLSRSATNRREEEELEATVET